MRTPRRYFKLSGDRKILLKYKNENAPVDVIIPKGVTKIEDYAFWWCKDLRNVIIPDSVTEIGKHAFDECTSLKGVFMSDNLIKIGNGAFYNCVNLLNITLPDCVQTIGESAFWWCRRLLRVDIPQSVSVIGDFAFAQCTSLECVTIKNNATKIGKCAFAECFNLTCVTNLNSLTNLDEGVFLYCTKLKLNDTTKEGNVMNELELKLNLCNLTNGERSQLMELCEKSINKPKWYPKRDKYYFMLNDNGICERCVWKYSDSDKFRKLIGNCFETEEDVVRYRNDICSGLKQEKS